MFASDAFHPSSELHGIFADGVVTALDRAGDHSVLAATGPTPSRSVTPGWSRCGAGGEGVRHVDEGHHQRRSSTTIRTVAELLGRDEARIGESSATLVAGDEVLECSGRGGIRRLREGRGGQVFTAPAEYARSASSVRRRTGRRGARCRFPKSSAMDARQASGRSSPVDPPRTWSATQSTRSGHCGRNSHRSGGESYPPSPTTTASSHAVRGPDVRVEALS
jgi:hypothetical protein